MRCRTDSRSRSSSTTRTDGTPSECSVIVLTYSFVARQSQAVRLSGDAHRLFFRPRGGGTRIVTRRARLTVRMTWRSAVCVAIRNTHVARSKQGACDARYVSVRFFLGTFVRALCWILGRGVDRGAAPLLPYVVVRVVGTRVQRCVGASTSSLVVLTGGTMDFLVMLEECSDSTSVLARVDSVPAQLTPERRQRDVVTLYGTPRTESLALAI